MAQSPGSVKTDLLFRMKLILPPDLRSRGVARLGFGMTYDTTRPYPRDLIGHGRHPPQAQWPGGARIALQFVLNYEIGRAHV